MIAKVIYEDITEYDNVSESDISSRPPKILHIFGEIKEYANYIVVIFNKDLERTEHDFMVIPKACIKETIELIEVKK
jgi:hypothetical protein